MTIVTAGPTASGKSTLAIEVAKKLDLYIINGDSRQIYKEIPISTAQPSTDQMKEVPHYLYAFIDPNEQYNIHKYNQDVKRVVKENKGKGHIIVGGTGLYIDSYVYGYNLNNVDSSMRKELMVMSVEELQRIIPDKKDSMNESDWNNPHRLIRTIEGKNLISKQGFPKNCIYIYLDLPMKKIERNIRNRIDSMMVDGLLEEARTFIDKYNIVENPDFLKVIGINELIPYFYPSPGEKTSLEDVAESIYTHTRQYAKRQKTWFKRNKEAISVTSIDEAYSTILEMVN